MERLKEDSALPYMLFSSSAQSTVACLTGGQGSYVDTMSVGVTDHRWRGGEIVATELFQGLADRVIAIQPGPVFKIVLAEIEGAALRAGAHVMKGSLVS